MEFNTLTIPVVFTGSFSRVFNIKRIVRESQLIGTKNFDLLKKKLLICLRKKWTTIWWNRQFK